MARGPAGIQCFDVILARTGRSYRLWGRSRHTVAARFTLKDGPFSVHLVTPNPLWRHAPPGA